MHLVLSSTQCLFPFLCFHHLFFYLKQRSAIETKISLFWDTVDNSHEISRFALQYSVHMTFLFTQFAKNTQKLADKKKSHN